MKNIKQFEAFISDTNKNYEHEDIVVAKYDTIGGLKKDKKYILVNPIPDIKNYVSVKDIVNNQEYRCHKDWIMTEMEYELGEDINKYNL